MDNKLSVVKSRVEDCLVSITWTHKIHEKQADIYNRQGSIVTFLSCIVTALTGSGALGMLAIQDHWLRWVTAGLAFASLFLFIYVAAFDFSGKAHAHRQAAKRFFALREEARSLLASFAINEPSVITAWSAFNILSEKYILACALAPQTTDAAVDAADDALKKGESTVTSHERELFCDSKEDDC